MAVQYETLGYGDDFEHFIWDFSRLSLDKAVRDFPWAKLASRSRMPLSIDRSANSILSAQNVCASLD
jgi:hypothetical protein